MNRDKLNDLIAWKNKATRKPLIVRGARQVGKTWLIKEFGRTQYRQCVYVNFENTTNLQGIFQKDFDINRIIQTLQIYARTQITPEDTLIVFDEVQAAERGLTSLKYFCEEAPQYHIVAAGSLLGMGLHSQASFPVGKVNFMDLRPLSFYEFLRALNEEQLVETLLKGDWKTVSIFHQKLVEYLKTYLYVGGMPEVDFVIQREGEVIPIEVKAETNIRARSFKLFCEKYQPRQAIRTSMLEYHREEWMTNVPLYGVETVLL